MKPQFSRGVRNNGGRAFSTTNWRLDSSTGLTTQQRTRLIGALSRASLDLQLDCTLLPAGSYTFCLGLENFLGFQGTFTPRSSHSVT